MFNINDSKNALLAYKEKLLQDIIYYEERIKDFHANSNSIKYYEESDSSDDEFAHIIESGQSVSQLKQQAAMLKTCIQATQELTSLHVLKFKKNVIVDEPMVNGVPVVAEPGVWREVVANCRIDLVPFSIMFKVHQPSRLFGPATYHCLKVLPNKAAHECELASSMLPKVTTPSDAIEIIRSYASEVRSRRTTLADLGDKYGLHLTMEAKEDRGYMLKCSNLQLSWRLESKSLVSPFVHKLAFDLDYMDEKYIKTVTQAHKQLANPSLDTDERTLLLGIIITACLQADGVNPDMYESMESEAESVNDVERSKRRLQFEEPTAKKRKESNRNEKSNEIMAPPKSIPKKVRPKGKENVDGRKKREDNEGNKQAKATENVGEETDKNAGKNKTKVSENIVGDRETVYNQKNKQDKVDDNVVGEKTVKNANKNKAKVQKDSEFETNKIVEKSKHGGQGKSNEKLMQNVESIANNDIGKETAQSNIEEVILASSNFQLEQNLSKNANPKNPKRQKVDENKERVATAKNDLATKNVQKDGVASAKNAKTSQNVASKEKLTKKNLPTKDLVEKHKSNEAGNNVASKEKEAPKKSITTKISTEKGLNKDTNAKTKENENQNVANLEKPALKKSITSKDSNENDQNKDPKNAIKNINSKTGSTLVINNTSAKNAPSKKTSNYFESNDKNKINAEKTTKKRGSETVNAAKTRNSFSKNKQYGDSAEPHKANIANGHPDKVNVNNLKITKYLSHQNNLAKKLMADKFRLKTGKENGGNFKTSKIPQKKLPPISERNSNKNMLRISPRKMSSIFNSSSDTNTRQLYKPLTHIPRLLKKPTVTKSK